MVLTLTGALSIGSGMMAVVFFSHRPGLPWRAGPVRSVCPGMPAGPPAGVLDLLGLRPRRVACQKDVPLGNASWLVEVRGGRLVLRRYHAGATPQDLSYEHAVLRYLAGAGWVVPEPAGDLVEHAGLWYCPTVYVPGRAVAGDVPARHRRRGRDLARLHLALRGLGEQTGQRPGWRPLHAGGTVRAGIDWQACVRELADASPRLAAWARAAAARTRDGLAAVGAADLPVMVVHGDFGWQNVHYVRGRLAGVIDFGLTHVDSRPYELAIARICRSPAALQGYRAELASVGWPLSELEEAAIDPIDRAFRVDQVAWHLDHASQTGSYNLAMIERQFAKADIAPPGKTRPVAAAPDEQPGHGREA
jgi:Ser/Thr protein kinase RdoA (MazF antagonist)